MTEKEPTLEQLQEFWEWCGFKRLPKGKTGWHYEYTVKVMNWMPPNETDRSIPYLPQADLNNLFIYAVPKLRSLYLQSDAKGIFGCIVLVNDTKSKLVTNANPARALFWAISEVIHAK